MLNKKTISFLLKIGIVAFALFFLYQQVNVKSTSTEYKIDDILYNLKENYFIMFCVILMMLLNWTLEAIKWRFLIAKIEKISLKRSIRAIFSGITVSTFTPNRIGEYGGRVFCLDKADRFQAVLITVIGSMAQLITTIIFGLIGILFLPKLMPEFDYILSKMKFGHIILFFLLILLKVLLVLVFLNISEFSNILSKIKFFRKYKKYYQIFSFYNSLELAKVLFYSIARYVVFTTQFYILLYVFNVHVVYFDAIVLIMTLLLVISIIPTIAITEIGVRGTVAILLFGLVSTNSVGILSATFVIWIINLLLPALIGTAFIFTLKFFRK